MSCLTYKELSWIRPSASEGTERGWDSGRGVTEVLLAARLPYLTQIINWLLTDT